MMIKLVRMESGYYFMINYGKEGSETNEVFEKININMSGRTLNQQALHQFNSKVRKKKDEGYLEDRKEADERTVRKNSLGFIKPMLAKPYQERFLKSNKDYIIQPKYNGHRCCIVHRDGELTAYSRMENQ